jgi:hypothetical protein
MSVQRIVIPSRRTKGWQARAYTQWPRYVSRFFSDKAHGGSRKAKAAAMQAQAELERQARKARRNAVQP